MGRKASTSARPEQDSMTPAAIVRELLDAFSRGDDGALIATLHPDVEFVPMLVATGARREPYRGHDGFAEYLRDARAVALDVRIEVLAMHADADVVVVLAQVTGTAAGGALEAAVTYVFRVLDGLVVHGVVGSDPDRAARAFALDTHPDPIPAGRRATELEPLRLHLDAVPQSVPTIRRAVDAYVGAAGTPSALRHDICLAVSEACTNVVLHAYLDRAVQDGPGPLAVAVRHTAGQLHVSVEDEGRGMVARLDSPGLGMGLVVMSRMAATCTITTRPEREAGCRIDMAFALGTSFEMRRPG